MKEIYPGDSREALEVFCLNDAQGEFFDISNPSHIVGESITIGETVEKQTGYFVGEGCIAADVHRSVLNR